MLQDWVFLLVLLPFLWIAAYTDLHSMLLKNWMTATVALLFLPLGLALLPLDAYFYRLGITVGVGVVLVAMGLLRAFGMGDAKYVTALTPYVAPEDYVSVLL
ncbi:MAG: prepilin peptidase, partial [Pseudomonadota bacterium]